ncbi:hypothetical protein [Cellulosimicrobium sp. Marseille-Q4280]|uniref:hypothetical protein n=1 Tax=Cellulosimicrobium sp. Marseille-Q4280 TaxID=2937992 RepID=UPI002041EB37|nr:hypothetical protein [Cellulosimicrobium sp. Marseille-Q4280]
MFLPAPIEWHGKPTLPAHWQMVVRQPLTDSSQTVEISVIKAPSRIRRGDDYVFLTAEKDTVETLPISTVRSVATVESVVELLEALQRALDLDLEADSGIDLNIEFD